MLKRLPPLILNTLAANMVFVKGGEFIRGENDEDEMLFHRHRVLVDDFYVCRFPVTWAFYEFFDLRGQSRISHNMPVSGLDWYEAVQFCNSVSEKLGLEKAYNIELDLKDNNNLNTLDEKNYSVQWNQNSKGYRLLTEAEWEYAARGGVFTRDQGFPGSPNFKEVAIMRANSGGMVNPVGTHQPNFLGIYEMYGNTWEWCWDWFDVEYYHDCSQQGYLINPVGSDKGEDRVKRGGSFAEDPEINISYRSSEAPFVKSSHIGLRIGRSK